MYDFLIGRVALAMVSFAKKWVCFLYTLFLPS